ncbi:hypothetical protein ACFQ07_10570, partial [Actinomadura adrarensis]
MAGMLISLTAGCGVQPSGVIKGASPPSGLTVEGHTVSFYLVADGRLSAVQRPSEPLSRAGTLALLAT